MSVEPFYGIFHLRRSHLLCVVADLGTILCIGLEPGTILNYVTGTAAFLLALLLSFIVISAWLGIPCFTQQHCLDARLLQLSFCAKMLRKQFAKQ